MFDAICTFGGQAKTWSIVDFQRLSDEDIERFRQFLECPKCHGKAFYRKKSVDGKAACFGSRYHTCEDAEPSPQRQREIQNATEVGQLIVDSAQIAINFFAPISAGHRDESHAAQTRTNDGKIHSAQAHTQQANKTRIASVSLEKILHSLLRGSGLAEADILIAMDDYRYKAKNLFVNFADAKPADNLTAAKPRMYWGTLSHADEQLTWLNPADCSDVGIPLGNYRTAIINHFNITDKRCLEGAGLILFGRCFWNATKNRKIIQLWDDKRLFISVLEE